MLNSAESQKQFFSVTGAQALIATKLLKKRQTPSKQKHTACMDSAKHASEDIVEKAFVKQLINFEELNAHKILVTEDVFRVALM